MATLCISPTLPSHPRHAQRADRDLPVPYKVLDPVVVVRYVRVRSGGFSSKDFF